VIKKNSLLVRTLSSFVMFIIFYVMVNANNLIFLIFSQLLLFLTSWEILRMLEFKRFINKKVDGSNFLLSKFQVRKYDLILICLINLFVFLLNFPLLSLQLFSFFLIFVCLFKLSDISVVKIICLLYVTFAFIFLNEMSQSNEFIGFIFFIVFFTMLVDISAYFFGSIIGGPKIMPLVSKKNPKIKLVVSGNKKIPYKQRNLINVGFVSKIKFYSYLKGASLFVNPMKTAFGSQVKMISALVFGKTIIASKKATLGLDTKNKFNKIFVANDHKEFARLIIKNIYSKKTNQINSRFYRNKYSFENITKNFIKNI